MSATTKTTQMSTVTGKVVTKPLTKPSESVVLKKLTTNEEHTTVKNIVKETHREFNVAKPPVGLVACYVCEPKGSTFQTARRVVALVVEDLNNGKLKYGAAIFRRDKPGESFTKKTIMRSAMSRFKKAPVVVDYHASEILAPSMRSSISYETFRESRTNRTSEVFAFARKSMYTHGVSAKGIRSMINKNTFLNKNNTTSDQIFFKNH